MKGRGPVRTPGGVRNETKWDQSRGLTGKHMIKLKKYSNGVQNSGPTGKKLKPAKVLARARAETARTVRARSR